jgi:hypothetical protein
MDALVKQVLGRDTSTIIVFPMTRRLLLCLTCKENFGCNAAAAAALLCAVGIAKVPAAMHSLVQPVQCAWHGLELLPLCFLSNLFALPLLRQQQQQQLHWSGDAACLLGVVYFPH